MSRRIDAASRLIRAPASRIYEAFATADAMETWLPPEGMTGKMLAFAFRESGGYRLRLTYGDQRGAPGKTSDGTDEVEVRFAKLVPHERIEQIVTFKSNDPAFAGEMRISWSFESAESGTIVTVRCEDVPAGISPEDHQTGLNSTLSHLAAFVTAAG
ncbi:MAG TPA: SRPBCC domain-containing protein [Rhodanobacteraceae bacterium]|nr:SRPBCC domain-containing protein [Rhodanobacteraceae bacterium]